VYIGGLPTAGVNKSYSFYSAVSTNTRDFRDNIFVNARSNSTKNGGAGYHYATYFVSTGGPLTCDYNDYLASGTCGMLGYYGGDKTGLPIVTGVAGNDIHSQAINPVFASAGGTLAANYLPSASTFAGTPVAGITTDYGGTATRSETYPAMGAWEYTVAPPCTNPTSGGTIAEDQSICSGMQPAALTSLTMPENYVGTLEYKWQYSVTSASTAIGNTTAASGGDGTITYSWRSSSDSYTNAISGATDATYTPGTLTTTTSYR